MGLFTGILAVMGVAQAASQISAGNAASREAKYNAGLYDQQAEAIESGKKIESYQYDRKRRSLIGSITQRTAKSGFEFSGSPVLVMMDSVAQLELDRQIGQYNLDVQKSQAKGMSTMYKSKAKSAKLAGYTNAFTTLLSTAYMTNAMTVKGIGAPQQIGSQRGYRMSSGKLYT